MKQNIVVKSILLAVICLVAIPYLVFLAGSIYEAAVFPQHPQEVTLAQAVEMDLLHKPAFLVFDQALYVSITDAIWECASVKQRGYKALSDKRSTAAVFSDAKKTAVVFVQVDGFFSCQDLQKNQLSGVLQRIYSRPVEYLSDTNGLIVIDKTSDVLTFGFCTHCTPSSTAFIPIVCLLFPFVVWIIYKRWKTV